MPCGKISNGKHYSIITDHLGTPIEAYNQEGELIWEREQDLYGNSRQGFAKENFKCPFKYQGQYYDSEVELCYNRFRYYHPETGRYISEDPIKLLGGFNVFAYVSDTNAWVDLLGLNENSYSKDKRYTPDQQALVDLINEQLMINQPMTKKNKKRLTNEQADMALELAQEVNTNVPMPYKVLDHRFSNSNNEGHYKDEGSNGHIHIGRAGKGHISVNNRLDDD